METKLQPSASASSEAIELNPQQTEALKALMEFTKPEDPIFILNGPAGTGKTTLVKNYCAELKKQKIRFQLAATTGRAAKVLSTKAEVNAKTLHSILYSFDEVSGNAKEDEDPWVSATGQLFLNFGLRPASEDQHPDVFIIDEASMISHLNTMEGGTARFGSGNLLADLLSYVGNSKIVFVGDQCQLPPVANASLSAALSPEYWAANQKKTRGFSLTEIVRQEKENEILEVAGLFRNKIVLKEQNKLLNLPVPKNRNCFATLGQKHFLEEYFTTTEKHTVSQTIAICHSNAEAHQLNQLIRKKLHGKAELQVGDLLMVVQNSYNTSLVNGDQVIVKEITAMRSHAEFSFVKVKVESLFDKKVYETLLIADLLYNDQPGLTQDEVKRLLIDFDQRMKNSGINRNSPVYKEKMQQDYYLNALRAKFGYAITVHKAQGGEWRAVFLYLSSSIFAQIYQGKKRHPDGADKYHRWFYTAVTRAKESLTFNDCPFVDKFAIRQPVEYKEYWKNLARAKQNAAAKLKVYPKGKVLGTVEVILNQNEQGVNGFVISEDTKEKVYFVMSAKNPVASFIKKGSKVRFEIMPPKGNKGPKAAQIQFVS